MKLLGLETATDHLGVAVVDGSRVLAEFTYNMGRSHSEKLLPLVADALSGLGLELGDLDGLAVSAGPGSFTGVRIGLAAAKTLAFATGLPLASVDTLRVLAAGAGPGPGLVCALMDARRGGVYAAAYRRPEGAPLPAGFGLAWPEEIMPPVSEPLRDWLRRMRASPDTVLFTGDGAAAGWEVIAQSLPQARLADPAWRWPRAAVVAWLGQHRLARGEADDPRTLAPLYLRRPQAELHWGNQDGRGNRTAADDAR